MFQTGVVSNAKERAVLIAIKNREGRRVFAMTFIGEIEKNHHKIEKAVKREIPCNLMQNMNSAGDDRKCESRWWKHVFRLAD
jgi:hypothetical protein